MESRRSILKRLALGTAGAFAVPAGLATLDRETSVAASTAKDAAAALPASSTATPAEAADAPSVWPLLAPLREGDAVGHGWILASASPVRHGAGVLVLRNAAEQREARIHVCVHDGFPIGAAHTARLDLVLMNGGRGDERTEESLGLAMLNLAPVLGRNEPHAAAAIAAMQTHATRVRTFASPDLRLALS